MTDSIWGNGVEDGVHGEEDRQRGRMRKKKATRLRRRVPENAGR